nr:LOW QUALITY PROTEIN: cubilin-like [Lytechinus pictus]
MANRATCLRFGLFIFLFQRVCGKNINGIQTVTPYCDGFLTLYDKAPSYQIQVPTFPFGFGDPGSKCNWYFYAPTGNVIKMEVVDLDIGQNESLTVFDGDRMMSGDGIDIRDYLELDFVSESNSLTIQLESGPVFKGTAVLHVMVLKPKSKSYGVLSANPSQCGGVIDLDQSTPSFEIEVTNQEAGSSPAYCVWQITTPPSTEAMLRFLDVRLDFYDYFMVADSMGNRLAEFSNIRSTPYEVVLGSNQMICLFDAYEIQSASYVRFEVFYNDTTAEEDAINLLSGGHITLNEEQPSFSFQTNNFSTDSGVYFGSYWFVNGPSGSKLSVEISDMDTGSGVYFDVRSGLNTPIASLSGSFEVDTLMTLDNTAVIWMYSHWREPGQGVTVNVSISDSIFLDSSNILASCGGSIILDPNHLPSLSFSSPNYGTTIDQYTACYWYFISPPNTRVRIDFLDIETQSGYVHVFDSVNSPAVTVSSIAGEGALPPFHSSGNGVSVLYNDLSDYMNGRGLLAEVSIIDASTPKPDISCGGQRYLNVTQPSSAIKTPWYTTPSTVFASTLCYWYVTCQADKAVSFEVNDMQTVDATLNVYDTVNALQQDVAVIRGETLPTPFLSSGPGVTIVFADSPSTYPERGFSAVVVISDPFSWDETTVMTSCGGSLDIYSTSTSLTFTSPTYPSLQPTGSFDCRWYFSGEDGMVFTLEIFDLDTDVTTYVYVFDEDETVTEISGNNLATTVVGSKNSLLVRFSDSSMTDTARGLKAKVNLNVPPNWDDSSALATCGGGIPLDFDTRTFLSTTPNYPDTNGDHFDCRWYVTSPSDTRVSVQLVDFQTDSNSFLSLHDGSAFSDPELYRASGSVFPTEVNATGNAMALRFYSNRATSGRGASVVVTFLGGNPPTSDIRLVGGSGPHEGRVELYHNNIWGTVCDDDWGAEDATVVCRMLGYRTVIAFWSRAYFGPGTGQIWLDDLQCSGDEKHVIDCTHAMPTGTNNCGHSEDAGVTCGEGADVTCDSNSMTVLVDRALLVPGDGATDVFLADGSCVGYDHDSVKVAISTSFDDCGTTLEETEDIITFSNVITQFQPRSKHGETVTRDAIHNIPVTCSFDRHIILGNSYKPQVGVVSFSEIGFGNFSLDLARYKDANFAEQAVEDERIPLGEPVFFAVNLTAVTDVTVLIESCWATPHPYPFDQAKYHIITDGCAKDPTVVFYDNVIDDPMMSAFSLQAFGFVGEYDQVFIHCEVLVCDGSDSSSRCDQGCVSQRAKRTAAIPQVRGSSSQPHTISNGPISPQRKRRGIDASGHAQSLSGNIYYSGDMNKMVAMGVSGILLAAGVMMAYVTFSKGQQRSKGYKRPAKDDDSDSEPLIEA